MQCIIIKILKSLSMINTVKVFLTILLLAAGEAYAQNTAGSLQGAQGIAVSSGDSPGDSLIKYMRIAGENNPLVLQRLNEYRASLEKVSQVGALPDPELTTGIFLKPMELMSGNQIAEVSLMQMFPWFGVLKNSKDEMSLMALAKYESFKDAKSELYFNVQRTWYQAYIIKEEIAIAEKNIALLRTIERLALTRFKLAPGARTSTTSPGTSMQQGASGSTIASPGGMSSMGSSQSNSGAQSQGSFLQGNSSQGSSLQGGSMQGSSMPASSTGGSLSDLYRIQMEIADLENNIALLKTSQNTVRAQFNALVNRSLDMPVYLPDTLYADTLDVAMEVIGDSMLRNNPMLAMIEYEQQSLEARNLMNTRMGYPMIGLGLNYSVINESMMSTSEMNGNDMVMPMVKITLPIYRKKYRALQQEAVILQLASNNNYQATANTLQAEIYSAIQSYLDAQRLMELYKNQHTLAQKSLDLMIRDFSSSGAALTDILRVRQQTLDYEFKQVEALANYNTSIAYIKRLMSNNGAL